MAKAHFSKKIAAVLGLFAITFLSGFAAANLGQKNDAALIEIAKPGATTTETAAPATAPAVETFNFNVVDETVEIDGDSLPVREVKKILVDEGFAKFTAKAVIGDKTVLLSGKVPTTVLEPVIAEFKIASGTQVTKFDNGCFVAATIE